MSTTRHALPAPSELAALLAPRIQDLALHLTAAKPTGTTGGQWRFGSKGSLAVVVAGTERGCFFDHEAGKGGDALGLVAHLRRTDAKGAYRWALRWLGITSGLPVPVAAPQPAREAPAPAQERDSVSMARRLWSEAVKATGTLVEAYLSRRGLHLPHDAPLAYHPACPRGTERLPAMLALMTNPISGQPCGVHRTFLSQDGRKAEGQAKMMLGHAGVIRLVPDDEVTIGLGLAEGIETSLSVMQGYDWRPVWAATSAGAIRTFPVLPGIEALTIFADADPAGTKAADACMGRWTAAGREARIVAAPQGQDFNDTLTRGAA